MSVDHNKYQPIITRIISRYKKHWREDLYQECYLKLLEIASSWDKPEEEFIKYSYRTLGYTCIDFVNKNNLNHISLDQQFTSEDGEPWTLGEKIEDYTDLTKQIEARDYLQRLPVDEVRLKELYFIHGYTLQEIVDQYPEIGKSTSTLSRLLNLN